MRISDWSSDVCSSDLLPGGRRAIFQFRDLSNLTMAGTDLSGADFTGCNLQSVNLADTNLSQAVLYGADLRGAMMQGARLDRADLRGRSEEHTSELQSLMRISYAVFCLKKKNNNK